MRRPAVDREAAVDPHTNAVIADGAEGVLPGSEVYEPRRADRESVLRHAGDSGAIPHVVEPRCLTRERGRAADQCGEGVRVRRRIVGAVAPREEANAPVDGGLEASVREPRHGSASGSAADVLQGEI